MKQQSIHVLANKGTFEGLGSKGIGAFLAPSFSFRNGSFTSNPLSKENADIELAELLNAAMYYERAFRPVFEDGFGLQRDVYDAEHWAVDNGFLYPIYLSPEGVTDPVRYAAGGTRIANQALVDNLKARLVTSANYDNFVPKNLYRSTADGVFWQIQNALPRPVLGTNIQDLREFRAKHHDLGLRLHDLISDGAERIAKSENKELEYKRVVDEIQDELTRVQSIVSQSKIETVQTVLKIGAQVLPEVLAEVQGLPGFDTGMPSVDVPIHFAKPIISFGQALFASAEAVREAHNSPLAYVYKAQRKLSPNLSS